MPPPLLTARCADEDYDHSLVATVEVGKEPLAVAAVAALADGTGAYVGCHGDGTIYLLESDGQIRHVTEAPPNSRPYGLAVRP